MPTYASSSAAEVGPALSHMQSLAPLSRGLVQLFRHRAGRGPTRAKSFWAGDDALLVLFGGGYTKAEKTLWDQGRPDTAMSYRHAVLEALEEDMRDVVERAVARPVSAVLAAAHHDPDVMAAIFLLEPLGGSGSAEVGRWGADGSSASHPPQDARAGGAA
jgi:Na+-translocating membrane potential-generating system (MpsC)